MQKNYYFLVQCLYLEIRDFILYKTLITQLIKYNLRLKWFICDESQNRIEANTMYLSALSGCFRRMRVLYMNVPRRDIHSPIKVTHFFIIYPGLCKSRLPAKVKKGSSKYCAHLMHIECSPNASKNYRCQTIFLLSINHRRYRFARELFAHI